ncbi:MAG: DUF2950 family protein [Planctomycetota bacterium]
MLASQEAIWRQTDADGNGIKDYWTLDVSCLHRFYRCDGKTKVGFIDISFARSDVDAYSRNNPSPFAIGNWNGLDIQYWPTLSVTYTTTAKSGYYYRAMLLDENGEPYNQNPVGKKGIKACNSTKFAFVAYPSSYGISGVDTFIVNEGGTIYFINPGSDANKVVLKWPGSDPTKVKGPGGKLWAVAE